MKATPILRGKEAERFRKEEKANRTKRADKKEVIKAIDTFCRILDNCDKELAKLAKSLPKDN